MSAEHLNSTVLKPIDLLPSLVTQIIIPLSSFSQIKERSCHVHVNRPKILHLIWQNKPSGLLGTIQINRQVDVDFANNMKMEMSEK